MKKQWCKLIFALPALALVLYAGGFISQLIRNYKVWQAAGQIGSPTFPSFELSACIDGLFHSRMDYTVWVSASVLSQY